MFVDCLSAHRVQQDLLAKFGFQFYTPDMMGVEMHGQTPGLNPLPPGKFDAISCTNKMHVSVFLL